MVSFPSLHSFICVLFNIRAHVKNCLGIRSSMNSKKLYTLYYELQEINTGMNTIMGMIYRKDSVSN